MLVEVRKVGKGRLCWVLVFILRSFYFFFFVGKNDR